MTDSGRLEMIETRLSAVEKRLAAMAVRTVWDVPADPVDREKAKHAVSVLEGGRGVIVPVWEPEADGSKTTYGGGVTVGVPRADCPVAPEVTAKDLVCEGVVAWHGLGPPFFSPAGDVGVKADDGMIVYVDGKAGE